MIATHLQADDAAHDVADALALLETDDMDVPAIRAKLHHALRTMGNDTLLTSGQAARLLGVHSVNTVKAWVRTGYIRGHHIGTRWKIPASEVERILESDRDTLTAMTRPAPHAALEDRGRPESATPVAPMTHGRRSRCTPPALQQAAIFATLPDSAVAALASTARYHSANRAELILDPGEALADFFVVLRGSVGLYRLGVDGRKLTLLTTPAGGVFWLAARDRFGQAKTYAEALLDETVICRLAMRHIRHLIADYPAFSYELLEQYRRWCTQLSNRLEDVTLAPVATRLAHLLAERASDSRQRMVTETHDELAWMTGSSRATITKELNRLRERGLLAYEPHHHRIRVLDPGGLAAL